MKLYALKCPEIYSYNNIRYIPLSSNLTYTKSTLTITVPHLQNRHAYNTTHMHSVVTPWYVDKPRGSG